MLPELQARTRRARRLDGEFSSANDVLTARRGRSSARRRTVCSATRASRSRPKPTSSSERVPSALVTGGGGFIGSNLARLLLDEGYDVTSSTTSVGLPRRISTALAEARFVEGDVRDPDAVARAIAGCRRRLPSRRLGRQQALDRAPDRGRRDQRARDAARAGGGAARGVAQDRVLVVGRHLRRAQDLPIARTIPSSPTRRTAPASSRRRSCACLRQALRPRGVCLRYFNVYGPNQRYDAYGNVIPIFAHPAAARRAAHDLRRRRADARLRQRRATSRGANLLAAQRRRRLGRVQHRERRRRSPINHLVELMAAVQRLDAARRARPAAQGDVRDSLADISAARAALGYEPEVASRRAWPSTCDWVQAPQHAASRVDRDVAVKVMTVLGTRPEIIRLLPRHRRARRALRPRARPHRPELRPVAQRRLLPRARRPRAGLATSASGRVVRRAGRPDPRRERGGASRDERPDRLAHPRRHEQRALGVIAKRLGIPVYHMEAGNRCYDDRVPEEVNRRIIDHSSDVLMPYTERSRANLLREGIAGRARLRHRQPDLEVLDRARGEIDASDVLRRLGLEPGGYFLVTMHREENVDVEERLRALVDALERARARVRPAGRSSACTRGRARGWSAFGVDDRAPRRRLRRAVRLLRLRRARAERVLRAQRQRHRAGGVLHLPRPERHAPRRDRAARDDRVRQQHPQRRRSRRRSRAASAPCSATRHDVDGAARVPGRVGQHDRREDRPRLPARDDDVERASRRARTSSGACSTG